MTIRIVAGELTRDNAFAVRLHRELVRATRARSLPGIARVIDHGGTATVPFFIVTEAVDGERLADRLTRGERWPVSAADYIVEAVAHRLAAARQAGLHHGRVRAGSIVFRISNRAGARSSDVMLLDLAVEAALIRPAGPRLGARQLHAARPQSPPWVAASRDLSRLRRAMVVGGNAHLLGVVRGGVVRFGAAARILWRAMHGGPPRPDPVARRKPQGGQAHPTLGTDLSTSRSRAVASANATGRSRSRPTLIRFVVAAAVTALAVGVGISGLAQSRVPDAPDGAGRGHLSFPRASESASSSSENPLVPHGSLRVQVPSVLGARALQAWRRLGRADLVVASVVPTQGPLGLVIATVPAPSELVARGTGVTLFVGTTPARVEGGGTGQLASSTG